ncbi:MAG TPA: hypothetical protein VK961_03945 [Chthoniobacter sp.]|nr:hypothetical protein [Chthoniobacter sp.]
MKPAYEDDCGDTKYYRNATSEYMVVRSIKKEGKEGREGKTHEGKDRSIMFPLHGTDLSFNSGREGESF